MNHRKIADKRTQTEISEIFSSLQGEGPYLGVKQVFVRFGRCNMHCGYCDELEKMREGKFSTVDLDDLVARVAALETSEGPHHSVSLTGGEPFFYSAFLTNFLPALKARGLTTYLETNGTLTGALERHLPQVDIVAMDIKPPSSTGDRPFWDEHRRFLEVASRKKVFVKIVVTAGTTAEEIERSVDIVAVVDRSIPFIFQPETEMTGISLPALDRIQSHFFATASTRLKDVRVIPQMHKIWGVR